MTLEWASLTASFVSLFAVMNAIPILPVVVGMVDPLSPAQQRKTLAQAILTSLVVGGLLCLAGGRALSIWGISVEDLQVAGGLILLIFAIHDLLFTRARRKASARDLDEDVMGQEDAPAGDVGVVPLGLPILMGPASMTAVIVLAQARPVMEVSLAFFGNVVINGLLLLNAGRMQRMLGRALMRGIGKIMSLVLATIAVSMLRHGLQAMFG